MLAILTLQVQKNVSIQKVNKLIYPTPLADFWSFQFLFLSFYFFKYEIILG